MTDNTNPSFSNPALQDAFQHWQHGNYRQAAKLYEQAIETDPSHMSNYWHLGLMFLLQDEEVAAQTTWMLAMAEGEPEQIECWTAELVEILQTEAERQTGLELSIAWAVRQHIREISPANINNLLHLTQLSQQMESAHPNELIELGLLDQLRDHSTTDVDTDLLLQVLESGFESLVWNEASLIEFADLCLSCVPVSPACIDLFIHSAMRIAYTVKRPDLAADLAQLCRRSYPNHLELLRILAPMQQSAGRFSEGVETAKLCYEHSKTLPDRVYASYLIVRGLMYAGGRWEESIAAFEAHNALLQALIAENPTDLDKVTTARLVNSTFFAPYFVDDPHQNRPIQNQILRIYQANVQQLAQEQVDRYRQRQATRAAAPASRRLKIGYLSHCLNRHSVGWLARWLFEHHDREKFEIHIYFVAYKPIEDPLQDWFVSRADKIYKGSMKGRETAEQINQDEIDILIDLDSITLDVACEIMALKPAPVQVSWLGWDASGLPAIDYYIADPYVLPAAAQDYYSEKIWRLPKTYIAVDGFEVGVPTLRRNQLDIPDEAVIYLSAQRGFKRHRDTARLQIKILKQVPNSYLIIKGLADEETVEKFFLQLAEEEGVTGDRLRFLPEVVSEATHRANLGIADVVLDTFPYNGATTTLETLWMGIPLVTRVGQQFAARNSYTMLVNAGISEGIAWTDQEYVEWGVRLGQEPQLRQQVAWKLWKSRQTAPLWNAKEFTREMENAYEQMWAVTKCGQ